MSLLATAPGFTAADAERIAGDLGVRDAVVSPLPSERDQNFLLTTPSGEALVLKIANAADDRAFLEAQTQAMTRVADGTGMGQRARPLPSGEWIGETASATGQRHFVRLVTWIPGRPAGAVRRQSPAYRRDLGRCVALLTEALEGFDHPAAHRHFYWDLAHGLHVCRERLPRVRARKTRAQVAALLDGFERETVPLLARLPRSVIHNDANDYNVIVRDDGDVRTRDQRLAGIIDFGDMVYSYTVGELAIAATYAAIAARDPLAAAADVVAGFVGQRPLGDREFGVLFRLMQLRVCTSLCVAAQQTAERPADAYLAVSQRAMTRALPIVAGIHPRFAEATFRVAAGLPGSRHAVAVSRHVTRMARAPKPILGRRLRAATTRPISLAVGSALASGDPAANAQPALTGRIDDAMTAAGATVMFGGYGEARVLYATDAFADSLAAPGERRTVHLGVDLFGAAGTPVHAPLAGVVVVAADNAAPQDYGPVIVLEHPGPARRPFYTLYGHLSRASLRRVAVGRRVRAGQRIGEFGTPDVNGGWTPHLHFQLITDLLELGGDFPGVARPSQRAAWLALCPDPAPLLGLPRERIPAAAPDKAATLAARRALLGRNLSIAYCDPVKVARGYMQYLWDDDGRRYLDAYNNVPHVGHAHPRVVAAAATQMSVLSTNTRYLHDAVNQFAAELCETLPAPLRVCWFVNSGSEANELALRLARSHTGGRDVIVLEAAYHGITTTLIDLSPYKHAGPGGAGAPEWVHAVPLPDDYRGPFKRGDPDAGARYAAFVADRIAQIAGGGRAVCAFLAESAPSVGGQILLPPGYLAAVYGHVRAAGGVCIADEVQTGYGRMGTHFWGFEQQGVVPDIVVLGKPIGNGHPIGAVVTTPAIAASFANGMEFFSTFGGSTVSAVVGLEVLRVTRDERLMRHARVVGDRLLKSLRRLPDRFPIVGDVRGSGLFLGVELVRHRATLEPAGDEASYVVNRMREDGILLGTDGPYHNVLKIRPPMPFAARDADRLVTTLADILAELEPA